MYVSPDQVKHHLAEVRKEFPISQCLIIYGAASILHGFSALTNDIDIIVPAAGYDRLLTLGLREKTQKATEHCPEQKIITIEDVDIHRSVSGERYNIESLDEAGDEFIGCSVVTKVQLLEDRFRWNRPKDQSDIISIRNHLIGAVANILIQNYLYLYPMAIGMIDHLKDELSHRNKDVELVFGKWCICCHSGKYITITHRGEMLSAYSTIIPLHEIVRKIYTSSEELYHLLHTYDNF